MHKYKKLIAGFLALVLSVILLQHFTMAKEYVPLPTNTDESTIKKPTAMRDFTLDIGWMEGSDLKDAIEW